MVIQHMHMMQNVLDKNISTNKKLKKASERLSSGYRINRASDDAAGLAVSEKLRQIRRGLMQGLRNIDDGVNYSRTVEGAAQEMHNMLHRLKEIAIEAANGTYDDDIDRGAMDLEYQQIIDEIDQMSDTAHFNGVPLFEKHLSAYEYAEGVIVHSEPVTIDETNDTLTVGYVIDGVAQECTVKVPHGTKTAEEIADLIDTALYDEAPELIIGMNLDKQFTMQAEGGHIDYIGGTAASLFYDTVVGSADGYLLGVTVFVSDSEDVQLEVKEGVNDTISFRVGNTDDRLYSITIDKGRYSRPALIDAINEKISEAGIPGDVRAVPETNDEGKLIIGLASKKTITGLAGNFIMIDNASSPIYDICMEGYIDNSRASLSGAKRIPLDMEIERGRNEYFVMNFGYYDEDGGAQSKKLRFDLLADDENTKIYATPDDLVAEIQKQIDDADIPVTVAINEKGGLEFTTDQYGDKCSIVLDKNDVPSGHMIYDLFDAGNLRPVTPSPASSTYNMASLASQKKLEPTVYIPAGENTLTFNIVLSDSDSGPETLHTIDVILDEDTYTQAQLVEALNNKMDAAYPDLGQKLIFSCQDNSIRLSANGNHGRDVERISVSTSSNAYSRLIRGISLYQNSYTKEITNGRESAYATLSDKVQDSSRDNVTATAGSTQNGIRYVDQKSTVSQKNGDYIKTSTSGYTNIFGKTTIVDDDQDVVGEDNDIRDPASLEVNDFFTNFTASGKGSVRNMNVSFDLTDADGNTKNFSISIPKGSTSAQAFQLIKDKVKDYADVSMSGNALRMTSKAKGDGVQFKNLSNDLISKSEKNTTLANSPGAMIDEANNKVYVPAVTTVPNVASHLPYTLDSTCNRLSISAGSKQYDLQLTEKPYTSVQDFADEINRLISEADGGTPTTFVAAVGNGLVFTGLPTQTGSITINSSSSCKIGETLVKTNITGDPDYNPATGLVEKPATIRAEAVDTHIPKTVTAPNNTITMDYTYPNPLNPNTKITETLTINVPEGTYNSAGDLAAAVQQAIANDPNLSSKIKSSFSSGGSNKGLTFTTVNGGQGYALSNLGGTMNIDKAVHKASTSNGTVDAGSNTVKYKATIRNNRYSTLFNNGDLEITDANNLVSLKINGTTYEFNIPNGVYSGSAGRTALTQYLKDGLAGADVTVTDDGSVLTITTNEGGADKSFVLNGANTAPYFHGASSVGSPSSTSRRETPCCIIGKNNVANIKIEDYYNTMSFDYTSGGSTYTIDIAVQPKEYTAAELAQAIQDEINSILPPNCLDVSVNASKNIVIKGADISGDRTISNFQGGLFERVFQNANYSPVQTHTKLPGTSTGSYVSYLVGRNKLLPESEEELQSGKNVVIYPGLNDGLVFDFSYGGKDYTVELTIPSGTYTPEEIAEVIQTAGREKMNAFTDIYGEPLPQDAFRATIGIAPLGVAEPDNLNIKSFDKLVLSFSIPDEGKFEKMQCIINGVRGNSAYRVFYDATKSPTPSKVVGKSDISNGILIREGVNDRLVFDLDGQKHDITIPADAYTSEQLIDFLNNEFETMGSMMRVVDSGGHLMFYTTENGSFQIDKFRGNAADDLFYDSDSRDSDTEIGIHVGRRTDSYIWYLRARVDDHLMRVNTTGVTTQERASKAIARLESAVNYLSHWRSLAGANENRSRHSYARNQTYIANLENADSTLRDADIAQEVASLSKQQILMQAQNAMMAQAKQQQSTILDVLG